MTEAIALEPARTALLVLDYQAGIVGMLADAEPLLARAAKALEAARAARLKILHVGVEFRPSYPEVAPRNVLLSQRIAQSERFLSSSPETAKLPAVAPRKNEIVLSKRRISAFTGTELELILRSLEIDTLIVFGVVTSSTVLSTVRHAFDADYRLLVVGDCCADPDPALHAVLIEKVLARQARITSAEELAASATG